MRTKVWTCCSSLALALFFATVCFSEIYEPISIENMIDKSDLIVVGTVTDTHTKMDECGIHRRYSTIHVQNIVEPGMKDTGETIVVESFEGLDIEGKIQLSHFRPRFEKGQHVLVLLLLKGNGYYEVTGSFRGKLDVKEDMIQGTRASLGAFVREVQAVADGRSSRFGLEMPSMEYQMKSGRRMAKITHTGLHLGGQFYGNDWCSQYPPPLTITFRINPAGATDRDSLAIPFADLKQALLTCVNEWNSVPHSGINFQVSNDSTSATENSNDGVSVVSWANLGSGVGAHAYYPHGSPVESDITCNTDYLWSTDTTYPGAGSLGILPKDFMDVATHELGHSVGLGHCDNVFVDNTMYYTSSRTETKRRTLEWGDKAGAVYQTTDPGGTLTFNQVWSAFKGSSESVELSSNVLVPSGRTLEIESGVYVDLNGNYLKSTGTGVITDNTNREYWDPDIVVKQGSTLKGRYSTIQSAINAATSGQTVYVGTGTYNEQVSMKNGVDLIGAGSGSTTIQKSGGTAVTFNNANAQLSGFTLKGFNAVNIQSGSSSAEIDHNIVTDSYVGVSVSGCNPTLHHNTISENGTEFGGGGVYAGYSADPVMYNGHNNIEDNGGYGIGCYSSSEPQLGSGGNQGLNNIRNNGTYNLTANANCDMIYAENNWWGTAVESSIRAKLYHGDGLDYIDYDPWRTSAAKRVLLAGDPREEAARAENRLGRELLMEGKPEEAITHFKGVIAEYGDTKIALFALDHLIEAYERGEDKTDLLPYLEAVARGHACSKLRALASEFMVRVLVSEGAYAQAIAQAEEVVKGYPDRERNEWVWFQMGLIYELMGEKEREEEAFRTFLSRYPVNLESRPNDLLPSLARIQLGLDPWGMEKKKDEVGVAKVADLFQSYPNPFNAETLLGFTLPQATSVTLVIYDVLGQRVRTLADGKMASGVHRIVWDSKDQAGREVSSGLYFCRLEGDGGKLLQVRKLVLLR